MSETELHTASSIARAIRTMPIEQLAFKSLAAYCALQNPNYDLAPHVLEIIRWLTRLERDEVDRLIFNCPPRHGKTALISEFFPAWYLGRNPEKQIIFATYSFERASDIGRKVRNQLVDPIMRIIFPGMTVSKDHAGMNRIALDQGGNYYAVGVGGAVVGRGADLLIIDDPVKQRQDVESEAQRRKLVEWFQSVAYTRLMPGGKIIVIMTRWHFDDLAGFLQTELAHENWQVVSMPALCESEDDILRRKVGEALWPARYPKPVLEKIRETIGTREWTSQYQQQPLPSEGGLVQYDWLQRYPMDEYRRAIRRREDAGEELPFGIRYYVCSWDTAFKESELNDPSACTVWGVSETDAYLVEAFTKRMAYPELRRTVVAYYERYRTLAPGVKVMIEDRGSGQSLLQDLKQNTHIPLIACKPTKSKQIRLSNVTHLFENGKAKLPDRAPWLANYETQLLRFPAWKEDDLVDATSQFLEWFMRPRFTRARGLKFWK